MSRKTRKLIWSAPLVAVLAVAGALAMFVMLAPNGAQAHVTDMHGPPGPVTGISAEPVADDPDTPAHEGRTSVAVTWQVPADGAGAPATSYRIDRSTNTRVWTNIVSSVDAADVGCEPGGGSQICSYTDSMLMPGATYYYRVFAMNGNNISPVSVDETYDEAMTVAVGAPEAPSTLIASRDREEEIHLSWTAPVDDGGADLEWYCIVVGNSGLTAPLVDLAATGAAARCKEMPAATTVTDLDTLTDNLEGGAAGGGTPTQGVIVISAMDEDDDGNMVPVTMYTHTGLVTPDEITLRYRIYAVNESDEISTYVTNTAEGKTVVDAVAPDDGAPVIREPGAVENLRAVAAIIGATPTATVNLYWTVPDNHPTAAELTEANANATRAIVLEYYTGDAAMGDNGWVVVPDAEQDCQDGTETDVAGRLTQCAITSGDLGSGSGTRTYRVRYDITDNNGTTDDTTDDTVIKGTDSAGSRAVVSLPVTTTSAAANADAPTDVLPLITTSTANAGEGLRFQPHALTPKTAIDLLWNRNDNVADPVAQPTGYVIEYSTDQGVTWESLHNINSPQDLGTNTRYTHHGVEPGDRYDYRVFPWHNSVYGLPVTIPASSLAAERPDPVLNLRVTADGTDTLELDWDMPADYGGSDILGYVVQVSGDVDNDMTNDNAKAATGTDGDTWHSQVAATDDAATEGINEAIVTTAETEYTYMPDAGSAPAGPLTAGNVRWFRVIAINVANDGVETTGGREVGDDGAAVSGDRDGGNTATPHADDISAAREVKGVTEDLTAPGPEDPRQPVLPGDPVGLTSEAAHSNNLIAKTDRGVLLLWNEPTEDVEVTSYMVERMVVGVDTDWQGEGMVTWATSATDERTAYVDNDAPGPDEVRMYRVSAKNDDGSSDWVEVMYPSHLDMHEPAPPTGVTAMADSATEVTVSWATQADDGGSAITSFTVQWKESSEMDYDAADMATAMADASSHQVTGLTANTSYDFQVIATNAIDSSDPSDVATEMTLSGEFTVTATSTAAGEMTLEWVGAPQNAEYFLLLAVDMDALAAGVTDYGDARENDPAARMGDITALTSGSEYMGIVIAVWTTSSGDVGFEYATTDPTNHTTIQ